jgi:hypothetical protein
VTDIAPAAIDLASFRSSYLTLLEEIFESVHGFLLDPAESMFETLETISANEASQTVAPNLAPIVAQVNHVVFLIDAQLNGNVGDSLDWAGSWRVESVSDDEWQNLIELLHRRYHDIRSFVTSFDDWDASIVGGALALITHCAYHLGQIREAMGVIRGR